MASDGLKFNYLKLAISTASHHNYKRRVWSNIPTVVAVRKLRIFKIILTQRTWPIPCDNIFHERKLKANDNDNSDDDDDDKDDNDDEVNNDNDDDDGDDDDDYYCHHCSSI